VGTTTGNFNLAKLKIVKVTGFGLDAGRLM